MCTQKRIIYTYTQWCV